MEGVYSKAYVEVLEILKYIPAREYLKIPQEKILQFKKYKDNNYTFNYDINIPFEEQNVLKETKIILTSLFNEYFLSNVQKSKLDKILKYNEKLEEVEKSKKYRYDDIFNKNSSIKNNIKRQEIDNKKENANKIYIEKYKETFFNKIVNKIKSFFYKK